LHRQTIDRQERAIPVLTKARLTGTVRSMAEGTDEDVFGELSNQGANLCLTFAKTSSKEPTTKLGTT